MEELGMEAQEKEAPGLAARATEEAAGTGREATGAPGLAARVRAGPDWEGLGMAARGMAALGLEELG